MTNKGRIRRLVMMLIAGGAAALGLAATAAPAQATVTPFTLRITAVHSGLSLAASSPFLGAAVVQETPNSVFKNQKWRFNFVSTSSMQIVNEETGYCMEPESTAPSIVRMQKCDDPNDLSKPSRQYWRDRNTVFNGVVVHRYLNLATGLYMDVSGASQSSGGLVITFPLTGGSNQMFKQTVA
jgi:hypothetical protein